MWELVFVPGAGLEPACLAAGDFKSPMYTNSTTRASALFLHPMD